MSTAAKILVDPDRKAPHPALYMFLIAPFGATSGYTAVCVAYLLTQAQVGAEAVAGLLALAYLPQTWKFLWAPVVDLSLSRKAWYGIGLAGIVLGPANTTSMGREGSPQRVRLGAACRPHSRAGQRCNDG